jgi:nicotinamidase/pyrazinamidase
MEIGAVKFESSDLLLVVDVQNDFCPGGALPIDGGDEVVAVLNDWIRAARDAGIGLYFSRDWHPKNHISFEESGGPWPPHCVQDTRGAQFHPDLVVPGDAVIVTKGTRFDQDQNSAFDQTGLGEWLHKQNIKRIFVGGLAQDVCVQATVLDGQREGFEMHLLQAATRPVTADGGWESLEKMRQAGAIVVP